MEYRSLIIRSGSMISVWILLSVLYLMDNIESSIIQNPINTLTSNGQSTTLHCCSDDTNRSLEWQHYTDGGFTRLCRGEECQRSGYSIDNQTQGCSHLVIISTSFDVAGLYQCNEFRTSNAVGAYVVVYDFSCSANNSDIVDGDVVAFHCNISWRGKLPFESRWLDDQGTSMNRETHSEQSEHYISSLQVKANRPSLSAYTLELSFLSTGITDDNINKFRPNVNWTSARQLVMFPVIDIRISCPVEDCQKRVGEVIACSADGFPKPRFRWLNWNREVVAPGPELRLNSTETQNYMCIATNEILGKKQEMEIVVKVSIISETDNSGGESGGMTALLVILVVTVVIFIIAFIVFLFVFRAILRVLTTLLQSNESKDSQPKNQRRSIEDADNIQLRPISEQVETRDYRKEEDNASAKLLQSPVQVTD